MKKIFALGGLILVLLGCGSGPRPGTDDRKLAKEKENIAIVERYIQAVEAKDTKTITDLLADNYMGYGPSFSDSINKAGVIESWSYLSEKVYDKIDYTRTVYIAQTITDGLHPGDYVSDWASLKITFKDGRGPVNLSMNAVYRIENGKITLTRTFYNEADVLRQLGYEFYARE